MDELSKIEFKETHPDIVRAFNSDTSREYSEDELLVERKRYFNNYKLKEGEHLTEDYKLICDNCKTNRFFQKNNFVVITRCECQSAEAERLELEEKKRQRFERFKKLKAMSLLGARYENATFENLDTNRPDDFKKAVERCKSYCEKWDEVKKRGLGIYFYGDIGTGKTHLTACIGNYLLRRMVPVLFTNFLEIVKQIRRTYNDKSTTEESIIHDLVVVDLLIIDDIGTERFIKNGEITDIQEKIYDIINARYVNQKPTIFSSNESLVQLVEDCGLMKKTVDRIASMSTAKIKLEGVSYRLTQQDNSVF